MDLENINNGLCNIIEVAALTHDIGIKICEENIILVQKNIEIMGHQQQKDVETAWIRWRPY